jgi:hypothetical protein
MRAPVPDNTPLTQYTLQPPPIRAGLSRGKPVAYDLAEPFNFTKGVRPLALPVTTGPSTLESLLFDLHDDPGQVHPITDPAVEARMASHLARLMRENDAPAEQYARLGLPQEVAC